VKGGSTTVATKGGTKGQPKGNSPSPSPSPLPSPSPSSFPAPSPSSKDPVLAAQEPCRATPDRPDEIRSVFAHYKTLHPTAHPKPTSKSKAWKLIRARLDDGYSVEALCSAIDGCHKTPHNLGANERGTKYLGLELIMRDAGQVGRFIENDQDPPKPQNEKERRTLEAAERFVERVSQ
jgi:hypothetical protein